MKISSYILVSLRQQVLTLQHRKTGREKAQRPRATVALLPTPLSDNLSADLARLYHLRTGL